MKPNTGTIVVTAVVLVLGLLVAQDKWNHRDMLERWMHAVMCERVLTAALTGTDTVETIRRFEGCVPHLLYPTRTVFEADTITVDSLLAVVP